MPRAIRTLGLPSRTAACVKLVHEGLSQAQIAEKLGISIKAVETSLKPGRFEAISEFGMTDDEVMPLPLDRGIFGPLSREAVRRRTTDQKLVLQILASVAEDDLFAAVLDDPDA